MQRDDHDRRQAEQDDGRRGHRDAELDQGEARLPADATVAAQHVPAVPELEMATVTGLAAVKLEFATPETVAS